MKKNERLKEREKKYVKRKCNICKLLAIDVPVKKSNLCSFMILISKREYKRLNGTFDFEIYSKTPKSIFKNFARPLNVVIFSLFIKFKKVSKDLLFLMLGKNLFLSSLKTSQFKI